MHAEIYEGLGVLAPDGGGREGGVDFRMSVVGLAVRPEVAESQHAVFEGAHTVETPLSVDYGLGELAFGEGFGSEIEDEVSGKSLVSGEIFCGENNDAGREAVAQRIQA